MATVSSIIDLGGYISTMILLQLQSNAPQRSAGENKVEFLMQLLSASGALCILFLVGRFTFETVQRGKLE